MGEVIDKDTGTLLGYMNNRYFDSVNIYLDSYCNLITSKQETCLLIPFPSGKTSNEFQDLLIRNNIDISKILDSETTPCKTYVPLKEWEKLATLFKQLGDKLYESIL